MTNLERIKSMNVDELSNWLNLWDTWEGSPWENWWNENYCSKCKSVMVQVKDSDLKIPCGWCEVNGKCKYFQELDDIPSIKQITKMWLESKRDEAWFSMEYNAVSVEDIKNVPTAYDVDKVVKELEDKAKDARNRAYMISNAEESLFAQYLLGMAVGFLDEAIEIIKEVGEING